MDGLAAFCAFAMEAFQPGPLLDRFEAKWAYHRERGLTGGVCDMTGLFAFAMGRSGRVANLLLPSVDGVVDDNLNTSDNRNPGEFITRMGIKLVRFRDRKPHLVSAGSGALVPALVLHFQSNAKRLMSGYAAGPHSLLPALVAGWRTALRIRTGLRSIRGLVHVA
jgi:hypothetical protein